MRVDARAESSCWDSVSITISIISVINAGLMAAGTPYRIQVQQSARRRMMGFPPR
jgi:hypothetical protein